MKPENLEDMYSAKIVADSISEHEHRLTTMEVTFPRFILAEFNTHRMFSRNSASSRAIPTHKQISRVLDNPYIPSEWGKYKAGMSHAEFISYSNQEIADDIWYEMRDQAVLGTVALMGGLEAEQLNKQADLVDKLRHLADTYDYLQNIDDEAVHKQWVNRGLEPFMWHTVIVTATEWDNFFALRISEQAQPEINKVAELMRGVYEESEPDYVDEGGWHLPLVREEDDEYDIETKKKISVARSARVSYLTHDGHRSIEADLNLYQTLYDSGHMSPFEHVATPFNNETMVAVRGLIQNNQIPTHIRKSAEFDGNFRGWHQYRKMIPAEDNFASREG